MVTLKELKIHPILTGLTEEDLKYILELVEEKNFKCGSIIIEENELSDDIYFILSGEVELLKWDEKAKKWKQIDILKKNEMFGEMAFLDSSPRSTRVQAIIDSTMIKLSKDQLDVPSIYNKIITNIALIVTKRLRAITQKYANDKNF